MAHAFDSHRFGQLVGDVERLASSVVDHEHQLAELLSLVESEAAAIVARPPHVEVAASAPHAVLAAAAGASPAAGVVPAVRELCVAVREQRQMAEKIVRQLGGDLARPGGAPPKARVLVVDDSQEIRYLVSRMLEGAGFRAITANNGLEGVIAAHQVRPAVVLMDVTMPVLGGVEATRLLKASPVTRNLNVIAYTATPEVSEGPLGSLFAGVLTKPASPDAVVATVRRFLPACGGRRP